MSTTNFSRWQHRLYVALFISLSLCVIDTEGMPGKCQTTGTGCKTSCKGVKDGDYQTCHSCEVYMTCSNGILHQDRPCASSHLVWDDALHRCEYTSSTCKCEDHCSTTLYCGRTVVVNTTMGINNVDILDAFNGDVLTTTDFLGRFTIRRVGAPQLLNIASKYYHHEHITTTVKADMVIELILITTPVFTEEPTSAKVFVGHSLTLRCEADSEPRPYQFIWYKDDVEYTSFDTPTEHDISVISAEEIHNVYHCVAFSIFNNISSQKAHVTFEAVEKKCTTVIKNWVKLPDGFSLSLTGETILDVGYCNNGPCIPTNKLNSDGYCCQADDVQTYLADNGKGDDMAVRQIQTCGCLPCNRRPIYLVRGTLMDLYGACSMVDCDVFHGTWIESDGKKFDVTDRGHFEFMTSASAGNIVFEVKSASFMPKLVSLDIANPEMIVQYGDQHKNTMMIRCSLEMVRKPAGEQFQTYHGISFRVKLRNSSLSSPINVKIEPNSIVDSTGELYDGLVKIYTHMVDIRGGITALEAAPGRFRSLDSAGDFAQTRTNGVLTVVVEKPNGDPLTIARPYHLFFDVDSLRLKLNQAVYEAQVYSIDGKTGSWNYVDTATTHMARRRKRALATIDFAVMKADGTYFSIQQVWDICYVTVDLRHKYNGDLFPCMSKYLKAITMDQMSNVLFMTQTSNTNGRACLAMLCDNINMVSMVMMGAYPQDYTPNADNIPHVSRYDYILMVGAPPRIMVRTKPGPMAAVSHSLVDCMGKAYSYGFSHDGLPTYT